MQKFVWFFLLLFAFFEVKGQFFKEGEAFDKSLIKLNTIEKLNAYIDSCGLAGNISAPSKDDAFLVNQVIEKKFYHGFSHYSIQDNWLACLAGKVIWDHLSAIVIPNDLVKHPMAACSQQSIVMMEVLRKRGYQVRKLGLSGHFVLETFYDKTWHVFDPDKEPIYSGFLHDSLNIYLENGYLTKAYSKSLTPVEVKRIFSKQQIGAINEFPAENARLFHVVTGYVTRSPVMHFMLLVLIFYFVQILWRKGYKLFHSYQGIKDNNLIEEFNTKELIVK
ncbi:hypothetical protein [Adhaeribacter aquaticus]|uniref:hypothetical protein n=1 Tax=Adhaeribacter aquaticus TaxID=299567 RepID=UPI00042A7B0E|nr:hypothetical protein [Adhaeribacter aquaticus]